MDPRSLRDRDAVYSLMRYSIPDAPCSVLASAKKDILIKRQKYSFHPNFDVFKGEKVYIRISSQFRGLSLSFL